MGDGTVETLFIDDATAGVVLGECATATEVARARAALSSSSFSRCSRISLSIIDSGLVADADDVAGLRVGVTVVEEDALTGVDTVLVAECVVLAVDNEEAELAGERVCDTDPRGAMESEVLETAAVEPVVEVDDETVILGVLVLPLAFDVGVTVTGEEDTEEAGDVFVFEWNVPVLTEPAGELVGVEVAETEVLGDLVGVAAAAVGVDVITDEVPEFDPTDDVGDLELLDGAKEVVVVLLVAFAGVECDVEPEGERVGVSESDSIPWRSNLLLTNALRPQPSQ